MSLKNNYTATSIDGWNKARAYEDMVAWCIVIDEESFNYYAAKGSRFYFISIDNWREVPCVPGPNHPHDKYGYSLIALEVSSEGEIASITSRWNTADPETNLFVSKTELHALLGDKEFAKIFGKTPNPK